MKASTECCDLIERSEGNFFKAYLCPAGIWTIGRGHTRGVRPGDTCTSEQSDAWFAEDIIEFETMVLAGCPSIEDQGHFDALVSFAYNMGPGGKGVKDGFMFLRSGNVPTIRRLYNMRAFKGSADEFPKWANPPLPGLVVRRARERNLFLGCDWRAIPDGDTAAALRANAVAA